MNFHKRNPDVAEEISDRLQLAPEIIVNEDGNAFEFWIHCAKLHKNYKCYYFPARIKNTGYKNLVNNHSISESCLSLFIFHLFMHSLIRYHFVVCLPDPLFHKLRLLSSKVAMRKYEEQQVEYEDYDADDSGVIIDFEALGGRNEFQEGEETMH